MLVKALAQENNSRVREAIFTALARIATPESALAVLPYLRSDDANIRCGALDALRAMPGAVKPHLPQVLADADADVAATPSVARRKVRMYFSIEQWVIAELGAAFPNRESFIRG